MADKRNDNLSDVLRARGVRKKVAKEVGALDGNKRRTGAKGEKRARQAVEDLTAAADEIRDRVLSGDPKRRAAARKAAGTRKRAASKRRASSKKGAQTRAKVTKARTGSN